MGLKETHEILVKVHLLTELRGYLADAHRNLPAQARQQYRQSLITRIDRLIENAPLALDMYDDDTEV